MHLKSATAPVCAMTNASGLVVVSADQLRELIVDALAELRLREPEPEVLTRAQAAAFLQVSTATLDRLTARGEVPAGRIGDSPRFLRSELLELVRGGAP